ncbi:MAG: division/cell wall cluster transcriptional repressor MraZ [Erythrobacter sp.]
MPVPGAYSGQAYSPAGDKGRYVLPPAFRKAVKEASGGARTLCLVAHERFECLVGFGLSRIDKLHEQLDREEERAIRLGQDDFDRDVRAGQLFQFEQLPFDDSGRFVMPEHLKELGHVEDGLYFQGAGDFFFVWNPDRLAQMDSSWKGAQATAARLVAEAESKAAATKGGAK